MSRVEQAADELASVVSGGGSYENAMEATRTLLERVDASEDVDAFEAALQTLGPAANSGAADCAGIVATACGVLVERGAASELAARSISERVATVLRDASAFVDACDAYFRAEIMSDHAGCDTCAHEDDYMAPEVQAEVGEREPELFESWVAIDLFAQPAIAMLSRNADLRREIATDEVVAAAKRLAPFQAGAQFLWMLLAVLDEEILVAHPGAGRAFRVHIDGIGDNFQLHTLLAGALVDEGVPGRRPEQVAIECARGRGPQVVEGEAVEGVWNLFNHAALRDDHTLPSSMDDMGTEHWIWNEGIPAEIEAFEGTRVVLLGEAPYVRTWNCSRVFGALPASLEIVEELGSGEVEELFERILAGA